MTYSGGKWQKTCGTLKSNNSRFVLFSLENRTLYKYTSVQIPFTFEVLVGQTALADLAATFFTGPFTSCCCCCCNSFCCFCLCVT